MRWLGVASLVGVSMFLVSPAQAQAEAELLEFVSETTEKLYAPEGTFERVLVSAEDAPRLFSLDDVDGNPNILAAYEISGSEMNGKGVTAMSVLVPPEETVVPQSVSDIAAGYRAEPTAILSGYLNQAAMTVTKSASTISYTLEGNDVAPSYTLVLDEAYGRIVRMYIDNPETGGLDVHYDYDEAGLTRVVVYFATQDYPELRWALVDFPVTATETQKAELVSSIEEQRERSPHVTSFEAKQNVATAPVALQSSGDLIPSFNIGSTSCNAGNGACFSFIGLEICFNVGIGVGLNTTTSVTMNGDANVEYPLEGREGEAGFSLAGTTGTSSIDYSFAYNASVCASVTFPFVGTCNSSLTLASGSLEALSGDMSFSPFLLPGDADRPLCTGDTIGGTLLGINPSISLCDLTLGFTGGLNINPNLDYCLRGDSVFIPDSPVIITKEDNAKGLGGVSITAEGGEAFVPAVEGQNVYQVQWSGQADLSGSVTLSPTLSIEIPLFGEVSPSLGNYTLQLGNLGVNDFGMTDLVEVELNSGGGGFGCSAGANEFSRGDSAILVLVLTCMLVARRRDTIH